MFTSSFSHVRAIAIFIFTAIACCGAVATARSDGETCSSRTTAYARAASVIRDAPSHDAASVGSTAPGDKLDILSSQRKGPWCWLHINNGWIVDSGLALSAQPVDATAPPQSVSVSGGSCFPGDTAYITGSMNIRASFNASSAGNRLGLGGHGTGGNGLAARTRLVLAQGQRRLDRRYESRAGAQAERGCGRQSSPACRPRASPRACVRAGRQLLFRGQAVPDGQGMDGWLLGIPKWPVRSASANAGINSATVQRSRECGQLLRH